MEQLRKSDFLRKLIQRVIGKNSLSITFTYRGFGFVEFVSSEEAKNAF
jgi:RNA recognition motif-containing protein